MGARIASTCIRKTPAPFDETEQKLYVLDAWEEAPFYSERERAALAFTEAVTRITEGHVPDAVFEHARAHFNEPELIALVFRALLNLVVGYVLFRVGRVSSGGDSALGPFFAGIAVISTMLSVRFARNKTSNRLTERSVRDECLRLEILSSVASGLGGCVPGF